MSEAIYYTHNKKLKDSYVYGYWSGSQIEYVVCEIKKETDKTITAWDEICEEIEAKKDNCLKFGNNNYLDITQNSNTHGDYT